MTAIHATETSLLSGLPHLIHNGHSDGKSQSVAFAQDEFTQLTIYTGNTIATGTTGLLNTTLKKSNQELLSAVQDTLYNTFNTAQVNDGHITVADQASLGPLDSDRSKYDITVKLFFLSPAGSSKPLSVDQLNSALNNLDIALGSTETVIDNFILSLPNQSFDENGLDEAELSAFTNDIHQLYLPVWKRLSELRTLGRITRLGVAEFSKQQLEILKSIAESEGVSSPEINQVNLDDCCVLPKDLISYAKAEGIELLTHGDATNILPKSTLASLLQPHLPTASNSTLTPNYVLKYSALLTGRGLIARKGYVVDANAE